MVDRSDPQRLSSRKLVDFGLSSWAVSFTWAESLSRTGFVRVSHYFGKISPTIYRHQGSSQFHGVCAPHSDAEASGRADRVILFSEPKSRKQQTIHPFSNIHYGNETEVDQQSCASPLGLIAI